MNIDDMTVGRISGQPYGYTNSLRLTVSIRISAEARERETIDHRTVTSAETFTLSWGIWRGRYMVSGGQCDPSEFQVISYVNGMTAEKLTGLVALHQRYHLNTLKAGCIHQPANTPEKPGPYGPRPDLETVPACPQTGYRYGHAWLTEELPAGFQAALAACLPNV